MVLAPRKRTVNGTRRADTTARRPRPSLPASGSAACGARTASAGADVTRTPQISRTANRSPTATGSGRALACRTAVSRRLGLVAVRASTRIVDGTRRCVCRHAAARRLAPRALRTRTARGGRAVRQCVPKQRRFRPVTAARTANRVCGRSAHALAPALSTRRALRVPARGTAPGPARQALRHALRRAARSYPNRRAKAAHGPHSASGPHPRPANVAAPRSLPTTQLAWLKHHVT